MSEHNGQLASFEEMFNKVALSHGRILVNQLAIITKLGQMHDIGNVAVRKAAEAAMDTLRLFFEHEKSFSLVLIGEYLFVEDIRIKYKIEDFNNFDFLIRGFKDRKLGSLAFNSVVTPDEIIAYVKVFLDTPTGRDDVFHDLARRLGEAGIGGISVEELKPPKKDDEFDKIVDSVKMARRAYIRVVLRVSELFDMVEQGRPADIKKLKRAVQLLVDNVYKHMPVLLRLAAIRKKEDSLPRHFANVCVLSLGVGKMLGLSKYQMARLGMAALLHDIGRQGLPDDILESISAGDPEAIEMLGRHPRQGVQTLLRLKGLNEVAISAMIVAYEHHRNLDGSGYPEMLEQKEMNLFSRIVRMADFFDSATSGNVYGKVPLTPDRALSLMVGRGGSYYDEELLGHFVRMMGTYPVGTLLLLSDGSLAVVNSPAKGGDGLERPGAVLIHCPDGSSARPGDDVGLSARDTGGGYARDVVRSLDPHQYGINTYRHLA